jgi:protein-L-isoaspartate(D-aspartate) O-methyltransferase
MLAPSRRPPRDPNSRQSMIDSKQQRLNMVESQVRPSDVTDRRIINAMLEVPREAFLPAELRSLAYMDGAAPVRLGGE